ncbi:MAG TPA: N-acetylneuraminate synthase family protein [Spirochaetia bacterium]|nr:N-acetylneuraminate synthase family protein [Spirochaetia bacterium]
MIQFDSREVGEGAPCLLVAELGTSHRGDLDRARRMIDAAAAAGADCIKFQLVHAEEILHPRSGVVPLPTGNVALYEQFRALERNLEFYAALKRHTEAAGARFLCSPFGIRSARELRSLGVRALKIASPEINHFPLLQEAASYGLPLFLSSGVSTLGDIERALAVTGRQRVVVLHCITSYPAPEEEYNLAVLDSLRDVLGVPLGLSDHSSDPVLVPALAAAHRACVVEKHFTLSRSDPGMDDPIALEPAAFRRMVDAVRRAEADGADRTIRRLEADYGAARVTAVTGSGVKVLAASERANYRRTNRSLHALRDIPEGTLITAGDVAVLRTEKVLRPGIGPEFLAVAVGATAKRSIPDGEGIEWEDLV